MKFFLVFVFSILSLLTVAQTPNFDVKNIKLPAEVSYYDHQFSGLYIYKNDLFFMSESRLQDAAPAVLYSIALADIDQQLKDTSYALPYKKYPIYNAALLRNSMKQQGDDYEGFEAMVIINGMVYLTVETATPSNNCYLFEGILTDTAVILNHQFLHPLPKPVAKDGSHIYNAGYEALAYVREQLLPIFEYNSFDAPLSMNSISLHNPLPDHLTTYHFANKLPFRLTDITAINKKQWVGINYFYKGGGEDAVYRVPTNDVANDTLIRKNNQYESYCRLVTISLNKKNVFVWKPLWELPTKYMSYNWEGIAAYKKGYFLINDKYTAARPYSSVLLFLQPKYDN